MIKKLAAAALIALVATAAYSGEHKQGEWVIGLSNSYYGNIWRKQMVETFVEAAEEAKAKGLIKDYIVMNGDGTQNQQIAQMNSLILQQVDAICINAFSPTAMNGVIDKAADAGIEVIAFDSIVTSPNCRTLDFDFTERGETIAKYVAGRLNGKGDVLLIRGISGSTPDLQMYEGMMKVLAEYPDINIVATIYGEASDTVTQKAVSNVLPSLSRVDAVLNQGGEGFGAVRAFIDAGREVPIVIGGNEAEFLRWWAEEKAKNGYETFSLTSTPGIGGAALWVAINVLEGVDVPRKMSLKSFPATQDTVDEYTDLKPGTVVSPVFTNEYVVKNIIEPFRDK